MINIKNANIITEDWVNGEWHGFGPDPAKEGDPPVSVKPVGCEVCSTSCMGDCSGSCVGGCGSASCTGECSLTCESSCSVDCSMTCSESCESNCFNECVNGCKQLCTGACSGVCEGCTGCSGGCIDACVNGCKHSCANVSTTAGTHVVVPEWPSSMSTDEEVIETLELIKEYLNDIMKYDYTRISDLDEAVVVHDGDTLAGQIISHLIGNIAQVEILPDPSAEYENKVLRYIGETTEFLTQGYFYVCRSDGGTPPVYTWELASSDVEDVGEINLNDMSIVISDFDNRTVRITAASFVKFIEANYKNYYVWKPYAELNEHNLKTKISWEFCSSGISDPPESIDLAEIISGGIGRVTEEQDGLMPHELYASSITHEFITGKTKDGDPAPAGTDVLRLTGDGPNTINDDLLDDLDARYSQVGQYMTRSDADQIYVDKTTYAADKNDYLLKTEAATTYLTQVSAAYTYATRETANTLSNEITRITGTILPNNYLSKADAATTYVSQANATSQIPARIAPSLGDNGAPGLMLASDAATLSTAASEAAQATRDIVSLDGRVTALESASVDTATTNYTTGVSTKGIVQIPATSSIGIGNDGDIYIKAHTVTNLIKNSTFADGFNNEWDTTGEIDDTISLIYKDTTLDKYMANIAILSDGEISQEFISDVTDGFTVGILFKKHPTDAKTIEVKIDTENYVSYTIPSGTGYVIGEFYIKPQDSTTFGTHTLYIHNPDVSTVAYEFTEVMVQKGRKFTGWMKNSNEVPDVNSINIISYNNNITFKDLVEVYTQDEYAQDGVTILHHAGDPIDPSSSIILHKDKNYFYMHITALHEIDGQIRQDVIPLRIDLTTGDCDISGNAVTAGTLIDNTGELVPTVAEINAFMDGSSLSITDQFTGYVEVTVMPEPSQEIMYIPYLYMGETTSEFTHGDIYYVYGVDPYLHWTHIEPPYDTSLKYKYVINKTVDNVTTELASIPHVGRFCDIYNNEIFNDYYTNNILSGTHSHVEGYSNTVNGSYTHAEGYNNTVGTSTAQADYTHIEGSTNKSYKPNSHVEGYNNTVYGQYVHVEGNTNTVGTSNLSAINTHIEGRNNSAPAGGDSHVEGNNNTAYGKYIHIEGSYNIAGTAAIVVSGAHVEGAKNKAYNDGNHVEGYNNTVNGRFSHAEGYDNIVYSEISHTSGYSNRCYDTYGTVIGQYNYDGMTDTVPIPLNNVNITPGVYIDDGDLYEDADYDTTDYIELPYVPKAFKYTASTANRENRIEVYDDNKQCICDLYLDDISGIDEIVLWKGSYYNDIPRAKYIRFSAYHLIEDIANYAISICGELQLFVIGNGSYSNRSNIFEVGYDKINTNGEIYQNGEPFVDTTLNTARNNPIANSTVATALNTKTTQLATMPTAAATYENQIVQFIGTTDANYTNGFFYKCVNNSGSYSWQNVAVSEYPPVATSSTDGLMSSSMFNKLDGITTASANNEGLMPAAMYTKLNNITTASANNEGLMPVAMYNKLDGIGLATTSDIDNIFS